MKLYQDAFVQHNLGQIGVIQNINSFQRTWKIFDIGAIVVPSYEHIFLIHYIISFDI
jgi:hypothetical protein